MDKESLEHYRYWREKITGKKPPKNWRPKISRYLNTEEQKTMDKLKTNPELIKLVEKEKIK